MRMKCVHFNFTVLIFAWIFLTSRSFNLTEYEEVLKTIPKSDSCFKSTIIKSSCWICNSSTISRLRYVYQDICNLTYGRPYSMKLLPCKDSWQKNLCYFKCEPFGRKRCCGIDRYGPLCLKCPVNTVARFTNKRKVCSGTGVCYYGPRRSGKCQCHYNFRGSGCQRCRFGYYGPFCTYKCRCKNGYCAGFLYHKCICKSGWKGIYCENKVKCQSKCSLNERCYSNGLCICKIGYEGKNCTAINFCAKKPCSKFATCSQKHNDILDKQEVICKCKPGFIGDGFFCRLKNPCHYNFTCAENEACVIVDRQMPKCVCGGRYHRVNGRCTKKVCKRPELCPKNSKCHYDSSYKIGQVCRCKPNYVGENCFPTLASVVAQILEQVQHSSQANVIRMIGRTLGESFSRRSPEKNITLLLPISNRSIRKNSDQNIIILNHHTILAEVNNTNGTFITAFGDSLLFKFANNKPSIGVGKIEDNNVTVNILSQFTFLNGFVYLIDKEIIGNSNFSASIREDMVSILSRVSNTAALLYKKYKDFGFSQRYSMFSPIQVFIIPVLKLTKHEIEYLISGSEHANARVKHLFQSMMSKRKYGEPPKTVQMYITGRFNSKVWSESIFRQLRITKNGQIYIQKSKVIANGILAYEKFMIVVDRPFIDSLPKRILPGQCEMKNTYYIKVDYDIPCPKGTVKIIRNRGFLRKKTCWKDVTVQWRCCPGFHGLSCEYHCPGPYGKPCNGNGKCLDGMQGNGTCICNSPFNGFACEKKIYPRTCEENNKRLCQPSKNLVEVIGKEKLLSNLNIILNRCKYMEKLKMLQFVQISLFIQHDVVYSVGGQDLSFDCSLLKRQILITQYPLSFSNPNINAAASKHLAIGSDLITIQRANRPGDFLYDGLPFDSNPVALAKKGMIFSFKQDTITSTVAPTNTVNDMKTVSDTTSNTQ